MKDLINFFFSFDKLMKHKLVPMFFWAALIYIVIWFVRDILGATIFTNWIAWLTGWLENLALVVMAFVGLRLACELAIAIFRISDNLSADGGASDLADIDPLEETRRAAEEAAKRAREVTGKAVDKTKSAASNLKDTAEKRFDKSSESATKAKPKTDTVDQVFDKPVTTEAAPNPAAKKTPVKKASAKKTTPKKTTVKKTTASTTKRKTSTATKSTPKKKTTAKKSTTSKKS